MVDYGWLAELLRVVQEGTRLDWLLGLLRLGLDKCHRIREGWGLRFVWRCTKGIIAGEAEVDA